jgi:SAM-dependent methyltransferase
MVFERELSKDKLKPSDITSDYNRLFSTSGIRAHSAYYRWILKLLNPKPNSRLLDVSCGEGIFLREVSQKARTIKTFGLDISDVAVSIARRKSPASVCVLADGQRLPFSSVLFDYVTCLGSLEHYLDQELGLREIHRVGKKDSCFCIVLPNSLSMDLFLHVLRKGSRPVDDFQIIERTATRSEWQALLDKNGFDVKSVHGSNLWPELFQEGTLKLKSLSKYAKRRLVKLFCPLNLAREFVFICKKKR